MRRGLALTAVLLLFLSAISAGICEEEENWYYEAVFLENDAVTELFSQMRESTPYRYLTQDFHVTVVYMPDQTHEEWYGEEVTVHITSYRSQEVTADDGGMTSNEGFGVSISASGPELAGFLSGIEKNWHITGSYRDEAKYTELVDFSGGTPLDVYLTGVFGCGHKDGTIDLGSGE